MSKKTNELFSSIISYFIAKEEARMLGKKFRFALITALMVGLGISIGGAGDFDINSDTAPTTIGGGSNGIYSSTGGAQDGTKWPNNQAITIGTTGTAGSLVIGQAQGGGVGPNNHVTLNLGVVTIGADIGGNTLGIVQSTGSTGKGTIVNLSGMTFAQTGTITLGTSGAGDLQNILTIGELDTSGADSTFNINDYSRLVIGRASDLTATTLGQAGAGKATFNLNQGAIIDFSANANGVTMANGSVASLSGNNTVAVGTGGFHANSLGSLVASGGGTLSITVDAVGTAAGNVFVESAGALEITNSSTLSAGAVRVTEDVGGTLGPVDIFASSGTLDGTLDMQSFFVESGARVRTTGDIETVVHGKALFEGYYETAGDDNIYKSGMEIRGLDGEFATSGNAEVLVGDGTTIGNVLVSDGKLTSLPGGTMYIKNESNRVATLSFNSGNSTGNVGNKVTGNIDVSTGTSKFKTQVQSDVEFAGNASLTTNAYAQSKGMVFGGLYSKLNVRDSIADIYGSNSIFAISGDFAEGANIYDGATVKGVTNSGVTNNITGGAASSLNFGANGTMDLSEGNLSVNGLSAINFANNSRLLLGSNGPTSYYLNNGSTIVNGNLRNVVELSSDYILNHYNSNNGITAGQFIYGEVERDDEWTISSVFGDFGFKADANNGAWLETYTKTDIANVNEVQTQLSKQWNSQIINSGLAASVSQIAQDIDGGNPLASSLGTNAGNFNVGMLTALANGNTTYTWDDANGNTYTGAFGKAKIGIMTGQQLSGVNYVAQDTARDITANLRARTDAYRKVKECFGSDSAWGSAELLNERYLNRIWAGGLGSWQDAGSRKGFEGYKYDGRGVQLGYDRAVGAAIVGASVSYVEGDYQDKLAKGNDSEIKHYGASVYGTYNASNGFYTSVEAAYVHSDNDIRARYDGDWMKSDYNTNTWYGSGRIGYDIQPCDNVAITPSIGVDFAYSKGNSHKARVNNEALYRYKESKGHTLEIPVEVQVAYELPMGENKSLTLQANGGYAYNLTDKGVRSNVFYSGTSLDTVRTHGRKLGHHSWKAGAGAQFRYNQWDIGVKYDYYGRDSYNAHRVMGQVGYSF